MVEQAELGLLLGDGFLRQQVDEVQIPLGCDLVAVLVCLLEVVAGVEKEDRDVGVDLKGQFSEQDIFGLEAAGQAHVAPAGHFAGERGAHMVELGAYFGGNFQCAH